MRTVVCDIGGTAVKFGIFDPIGFAADQFSVLDPDGIERLPERLANLVNTHRADRIAISAPGPFDFESGTSLMRHKLPSLYGVSLRDRLSAVCPDADICFVHDLTAFAAGVLAQHADWCDRHFACVTLGTGLGYAFVQNGKVLLNAQQTPLHSLWNQPYERGICEDYVSVRAFLREAEQRGFDFDSVKALADATDTEPRLQAVFDAVGRHFGGCIQLAHMCDPFDTLVIGGQISRSFARMEAAFSSVCAVPYTVVDDPGTCALHGLYAIAERGKDAFCKIV